MAHRIVWAGAALASAAVLMLPPPALATGGHDHTSPSADPHAGHAGHGEAGDAAHDHGTPENGSAGHGDHGATGDDAGHTDHGAEPDSVSPEVRNLVLSGFAGVNAAVIFGAWMVRRTGPDPDPRKRTPKASR